MLLWHTARLGHHQSTAAKFQVQRFIDVAISFFDHILANDPHIRSTVLDIRGNVNRSQDQKPCPLLGVLKDETTAFAETFRTAVYFLEQRYRISKQSSF